VWSYKTEDAIDSYAAVANGVVYIGSKDDYVYALNAHTGEKIWTYKTGADVESFTSVANGVVYIGSNDYYIYAIGTINTQQPTSPSPTGLPSPTVSEFALWTIPLLLSLMVAAGLLVSNKKHKGS
jgi:eukaryotic-like serine/threonine-protein kinase